MGEAEIIVAKERNGPIGPVRAHLNAPWTTFLPMSNRENDPAGLNPP